MLFRCTPVPGTTTPEHDPFEHVTEHAQPSRSSTATCVVDPSGRAARQEPLDELRVVEPVEELGRALGLRPLHRVHDLCDVWRVGGLRVLVEQGERVRDQDPAGRRWWVREHLSPTVRHPDRGAGHDLVGGEVLRGDDAAARGEPVDDRRPDVARVERRRPLRAQPLERIGELRLADDVAGSDDPSVGREQRGALGRRGHDPGEDLDHVRLRRVQLDPVARELRRRRDELGERHPPESRGRLAHARRHPVGPDRRGADVEHLDGVAERHAHGYERRRRRPGRPRVPAPRRRSRAGPAPCPARPRACSRRRRGRSAAARRRTTRASRRARRRPRCRRCAAHRRRRRRSPDGRRR